MVAGGTEDGVAVAKSFRPHPRLIGLQRVIELLEVREDPPLAGGTWNSETFLPAIAKPFFVSEKFSSRSRSPKPNPVFAGWKNRSRCPNVKRWISALFPQCFSEHLLKFTDVIKEAYFARVSLAAYGYYRTPEIPDDRAAGRGKPIYYLE